MNKDFDAYSFSPEEEERLKTKVYDLNMNPQEWIARFGHNIISGDMRLYKYEDKEFEKWIQEAYNAILNEGLSRP